MNDLIRREDAIKAVKSSIADSWGRISPVNACQNIRCLPSADRPRGKWIYVTVEEWMRTGRDYGHHCSECDEMNESGGSNFCPNCGADMRGEE